MSNKKARKVQKFFLCFSVTPWTKKISRAIVKERKIYLTNSTLIKNKPLFLVEVKSSELEISKSLKKFQSLLDVPAIQVVNIPETTRLGDNILVTSIVNWIAQLP